MAFRLTEVSLSNAISHLCRFGDTDVFPHLPEISFLRDCKPEIIKELAALDLDNFVPAGANEALAPKGLLSFRVVHQMPILETVLFLASVLEIAPAIKEHRDRLPIGRSFSYKYQHPSDGSIFKPDHTFRNWLNLIKTHIEENHDVCSIVEADVSDYYSRINFHRLDNLLDQAAPDSGAAKYIKKQIKRIRGKQSFGIPIGGSAARLLAELALTDTDEALKNSEITATRYVDDFRIFLKASQSPYDVVALLAEQLVINEGLSLNSAKTRSFTRENYINHIQQMLQDVSDQAEGEALTQLTGSIYFDDEPDDTEVEALSSINILGYLDKELSSDAPDMGRVRTIFRALRLVLPPDAIGFIVDNFERLTFYSKDLCLLMQGLESQEPQCFDNLSDKVVDHILSSPAESVQVMRTWLLELYVRGVIAPTHPVVRRLDKLVSSFDRRQLLLIRGRLGDLNYFRRFKTGLLQFSPFECPSLVWGASCLPRDEYETWLITAKASFTDPLGAQFIEWAKRNRSGLQDALFWEPDDHPD